MPEILNVPHLKMENLKKTDAINNNCPKPGTAKKDENKLKREIGLLNAVAITVGAIIGSGIFIAPKGILVHTGSIGVSLCMWVFCGFVSILGALCYAELGTTFPSAGGSYTYIHEAFGPALAFLSLWSHTLIYVCNEFTVKLKNFTTKMNFYGIYFTSQMCDMLDKPVMGYYFFSIEYDMVIFVWFYRPMGNAILGLAFANYVTQPFFETADEIPELAIQLLAASAICFVTYLNCCDTKRTKNLWNAFLFLKITPLILIILAGSYSVATGNTKNFDDIWANSRVDVGSLVLASFSGSFAFGGWNAIVSMMEELKEPNKNLPRGVMISLLLVTIAYLLTNASYFAVLTPHEILSSDAVAVTFVDKLLGVWGWVVPVFVSISIFGALSIHMLTTSRGCYVGSRCNQLPSFISLMTLSTKLPVPATIFLSFLSLVFLVSSDVFVLIEFGAITSSFLQVLTVAALIYLRWRKPDLERPFKVSFIVPIVYFLLCMVVFIIPIYVKPVTSAVGAILTFSSIPIYYLFIIDSRKFQAQWIRDINEKITFCVQKLLIAAKED